MMALVLLHIPCHTHSACPEGEEDHVAQLHQVEELFQKVQREFQMDASNIFNRSPHLETHIDVAILSKNFNLGIVVFANE